MRYPDFLSGKALNIPSQVIALLKLEYQQLTEYNKQCAGFYGCKLSDNGEINMTCTGYVVCGQVTDYYQSGGRINTQRAGSLQ